ncbi:hypothetical protein G6F51_013748 [Rhizopus arrhizus]|uniref:Transposase Tc1-like domain-containing protein n=1 Tax=Rhizopus oryzae TaxID=64495 RepID=A0A9P6XRI5_RHIOR|nr:hypothetical protein G6F51_013748 [Rhizopus arrhizus]
MQKISQERINNIKKHLLDNLTISGVMEAIGESRGTVQRVNEMLKIPATGNKGGSPKALTERDQKYIVQAVAIKSKENAVEATHGLEKGLGKSVSVYTVRRVLGRAGLVSFVKPKKPLITIKHKKDRLQWAYDHISCTSDDWDALFGLTKLVLTALGQMERHMLGKYQVNRFNLNMSEKQSSMVEAVLWSGVA